MLGVPWLRAALAASALDLLQHEALIGWAEFKGPAIS